MHNHKKRVYKNLTVVGIGLILAISLSQVEAFHSFLLQLGGFGYIGAFIAGIFFVFTFTVATSALVLLILAETGLVGFSMLLIILTILYRKILSADKIAVIAISQLLLMGMFDHYLWTLQQGQLMVVLFISLALIPRNGLN